jgi:hypothetical protein
LKVKGFKTRFKNNIDFCNVDHNVSK